MILESICIVSVPVICDGHSVSRTVLVDDPNVSDVNPCNVETVRLELLFPRRHNRMLKKKSLRYQEKHVQHFSKPFSPELLRLSPLSNVSTYQRSSDGHMEDLQGPSYSSCSSSFQYHCGIVKSEFYKKYL